MTEKQKVTITVAGPAGSGKSTFMALIANQIDAHGIPVVQTTLNDEPVVMGRLGTRLKAIGDRVKVEIQEVMTR